MDLLLNQWFSFSSEAEINELLSDNEAFQDFFLGLEQVRSMTSVSKELQQSNEQLARKTLEREEELRILQTELRGKIAAMNEARTTLEGKERERDKLLSVNSSRRFFATPAQRY